MRLARPELPVDMAESSSSSCTPTRTSGSRPPRPCPPPCEPFTRFTPPPPAAQGGLNRTQVLVIDSDAMSRGMIAGLLGEEFDVADAATVPDARSYLEKHPFDLIVLDATPDKGSAQELITPVRKTNAERPVMILVVSGRGAGGGAERAGVGRGGRLHDQAVHPGRTAVAASALLGRRDTVHGRGVLTMETMRFGTRRPPPRSRSSRRPARPCRRTSANPWDLMTVTVSRLLVETGYLAPGFRSRVARYVRAMAQAVEGTGEYLRLKDQTYITMLAASSSLYDVGLLVHPRRAAAQAGQAGRRRAAGDRDAPDRPGRT